MFFVKTINAASIVVALQIFTTAGLTVKVIISILNIHLGQALVNNTLKAYSIVNTCSDEFTKIDTTTE